MTSNAHTPEDYMQPISYDGRPVAMAGKDRFWITHSIALLPDGHPLKRMVSLMCAFARDVQAGETAGPYDDARAERFAREALLPATEFLAEEAQEDIDLATRFQVPLREVAARRQELAANQ